MRAAVLALLLLLAACTARDRVPNPDWDITTYTIG